MGCTHDWIALSLLPGLGPAGFWRLVNLYGSPGEVLRQRMGQLRRQSGLRASKLAGFSELTHCQKVAEAQILGMQAAGGRMLTADDLEYPELLRSIPDPPAVLYCLGNTDLLHTNCLAVVGSRSATSYGRRMAFSLSEQLARRGVTIVSGLALGIDSEAHGGALSGGGRTIAVLGCGLDVVYPKQNKDLYDRICLAGLLVSEYPLGTRPEGFRFPARNRIIAGLSHGVMVVEAARKSGSLITAQLGLDFGREIFAVPGQLDSFKSEGAHWLIQQGAQLVISVDDILEALRFQTAAVSSAARAQGNADTVMEPEMAGLLAHLGPYPQTIDEVLSRAGLSVARASELFLILELDGHIEILPGDLVRRITDGN